MAIFYFSCSDQDVLTNMLVGMQGNRPVMLYSNVMGPLPATPAIPAGVDANGDPTPAIPAAGVAGQYYMSVNILYKGI